MGNGVKYCRFFDIHRVLPKKLWQKIVLLNVLPNYQGAGLGRRLIDAVAAVAARQGLTRLVVATSNDDLLALYLYQRNGFVITDVRAGEILRHHGQEETGFAGMPVRDEIRLERHL